MRHFILGLSATLAVALGLAQSSPADDTKPWHDAEIKKLQGRWTAFREEQIDNGKPRRQWLDLEFSDSRLQVAILDEKKQPRWDGALDVLGVEEVGPLARIDVGSDGRKKAEIYCDFVGDKMIVVGRVIARPFEGFSLSGEFQRVQNK